jgi:hypothetical protein
LCIDPRQLFFTFHQFADLLEALVKAAVRNMVADGVDRIEELWNRLAEVLDEAKIRVRYPGISFFRYIV